MTETSSNNTTGNASHGVAVQRLVRLSDRVGSLIHGFDAPEHRESVRQLRREVKAMEIQLEAAKNRHCFCPDCRDKVRDEECLRCQVQRLMRKLRKYEPNDPDETPRGTSHE